MGLGVRTEKTLLKERDDRTFRVSKYPRSRALMYEMLENILLVFWSYLDNVLIVA